MIDYYKCFDNLLVYDAASGYLSDIREIEKELDKLKNGYDKKLARIVPDIRDVDERSRSRMVYKLY